MNQINSSEMTKIHTLHANHRRTMLFLMPLPLPPGRFCEASWTFIENTQTDGRILKQLRLIGRLLVGFAEGQDQICWKLEWISVPNLLLFRQNNQLIWNVWIFKCSTCYNSTNVIVVQCSNAHCTNTQRKRPTAPIFALNFLFIFRFEFENP